MVVEASLVGLVEVVAVVAVEMVEVVVEDAVVAVQSKRRRNGFP